MDSFVQILTLNTGRWDRLGSMAFAKEPWFLAREFSTAFEELWQPVEVTWTETRGRITARDPLDDQICDSVRNLVALHLSRSYHYVANFQQGFVHAIEKHGLNDLVGSPEFAAAFYRHETGLEAAGPQAIEMGHSLIAQSVLATLGRRSESFGANLKDRYLACRAFLSNKHVQIGVSAGTTFLLGDSPALTVNMANRKVGLASVSLDCADLIVMPLTPHHVATFGPSSTYMDLPGQVVELVNTLQIAGASKAVVAQPNTGHSNETATARYLEVSRNAR